MTPSSAAASAGRASPPPVAAPIVTPRGVTAPGRRRHAGFWIRYLAHVLDSIFLTGASLFVFLTFSLIVGLAKFGAVRMGPDVISEPADPTATLIAFVACWLYEAGFTSSKWQATPGKMGTRLVVTDVRGGRLSFGRATGRFFSKLLSIVLATTGYWIQPFTRKRQALHDLLAGTLVMRNPRE